MPTITIEIVLIMFNCNLQWRTRERNYKDKNKHYYANEYPKWHSLDNKETVIMENLFINYYPLSRCKIYYFMWQILDLSISHMSELL